MKRFLRVVGVVLLLAGTSGVAFAGPNPPVPEINPSLLSSAVTLLAGGLLLLKANRTGK